MQNREELRQKGHDGSQKMTSRERGKNIIFRRGGGINIVFGPKYRPLVNWSNYQYYWTDSRTGKSKEVPSCSTSESGLMF